MVLKPDQTPSCFLKKVQKKPSQFVLQSQLMHWNGNFQTTHVLEMIWWKQGLKNFKQEISKIECECNSKFPNKNLALVNRTTNSPKKRYTSGKTFNYGFNQKLPHPKNSVLFKDDQDPQGTISRMADMTSCLLVAHICSGSVTQSVVCEDN